MSGDSSKQSQIHIVHWNDGTMQVYLEPNERYYLITVPHGDMHETTVEMVDSLPATTDGHNNSGRRNGS